MAKSTIPKDEYPSDLQAEEDDVLSQDDSSENPPSDIVAFNELRSCADLVRMYDSKQLEVRPDFQRDIVWSNLAQTRFIDSLTKQLPIPSMCIGLDYNTNSRVVIDGLQRMSSIIRFLTDSDWKLATLVDVDKRLSGRKVSYVEEKFPRVYGLVENLTIPITVLRCDFKNAAHMEYLFTIFHRLNTGGNKLSNQEIRNCIYSGAFNELLKECVQNEEFRTLFALEDDRSYRFAYEEFVLRFFTFADNFKDYDGRLSYYLNAYMQKRRNETKRVIDEKRKLFERTVTLLHDRITKGAALPKLSKATVEAIFVGIGRNIDTLEVRTDAAIKALLATLRLQDEFKPENLKNALTTKDKLVARMKRAVKVFSS